MDTVQGNKELSLMAQQLEADFPLALNKPYDDPYFPHMTLIQKLTNFPHEQPVELVRQHFNDKTFSFTASEIVLLNSASYKATGLYEELWRLDLKQ